MFLTIKQYTELLSIEQIIYIKMDLALNNLQRLICHKTHQTKPNQTEASFSIFSKGKRWVYFSGVFVGGGGGLHWT